MEGQTIPKTPKYSFVTPTVTADDEVIISLNNAKEKSRDILRTILQGGNNSSSEDNSDDTPEPRLDALNVGEFSDTPRLKNIEFRIPTSRIFDSSHSKPSSSSISKLKTPLMPKARTPCESRGSARKSMPSTPRPNKSCNIIAIVEGRGMAKGEVGMACIDLKNPILILSQFTDTQAYVKTLTQINVYYPSEILMPSSACDTGNRTKLFNLLSSSFSDATLVTVQRKYFNETRGLQCIKDLCVPEYKTIEMEVMQKYYCLSACAALIKYVEFIQNITYAAGSLKTVFQISTNTMMIDSATASHLELVTNEFNYKSNDTLYGLLQRTQTHGGNRFLRANLLQPPSDLTTIETRLNCISELIEKEELFANLRALFSRFVDIEQVLSMCVTLPKEENIRSAELRLNNIIYLKHTLDLVEPLQSLLENTENSLFQTYLNALQDARFDEMKQKIGLVIDSNVRYQKGALNMRTQKCFAVKPNINGLLDIARRTYSEIVSDIYEMVRQLAEHYNLPLHLGYSGVRGFFMQIYANPKSGYGQPELPALFIKVVRKRNVITFTSKDLIKFNDRVKESLNEILLMSNSIVSELFCEIRGSIVCLYELTEAISTLDFLVALAHYCTLNKCVKPSFSNSLAVKNGVHPILIKNRNITVIPNNTFMSKENNFIIITGPNMTGKTTYLKQVAILQIMAQIGSYVPAEFASFRLTDQIFSRLDITDNIENNFSAFTLEMKEANYILRTMTERSLIIIDELGRGTSIEDGLGLSWAISEKIIQSKALTLFSTHYKELTKLEALYPNVANYHFTIEYSINELAGTYAQNYPYSLKRGHCKDEKYGLELARLSAMPQEVVQHAQKLVSEWNQETEKLDVLESAEFLKRRKTIQLSIHLLQLARNPDVGEIELRQHLHALQEQFAATCIQQDFNEDLLTFTPIK